MSNEIAGISQQAVWDTADKFLRNVVDPEDYGEYILPFLILRRLECLLDDTKADVLTLVSSGKYPEEMLGLVIGKNFDLAFYNTSELDMGIIGQTDDHVEESLLAYLDGFSENITDIWAAFDFKTKIAFLQRNNRLWQMVRHFAALDLHPATLSDVSMGDLFEDIMYRAFTTKGKGAGAFYTPRDAIKLMVDVLFSSDDEGLTGTAPTRSVYDPTAGTGGMLLVAERTLEKITDGRIDVSLFGQEMMDWSYAIGKADLLVQGGHPDSIRQGDTLRVDRFAGETFDYVLSNPPFGVDWSVSKAEVMGQAEVPGSRFSHGLPPVSDGQMLFLCHVASKMAPKGDGGAGGRAAVVSNGSPLFTGKAGSGPDRIRAWLLTNDLVDAIIALPEKMFYGTGIATYVWILDNNKEPHRRGKIQLIDGSGFYSPMRKGMGDKSREISDADRLALLKIYADFTEGEHSKIVTADDLGYRDVPVVKQARYSVKVTPEAVEKVMEHSAATEGHRALVEGLDGAWNDLPALIKARVKGTGLKVPAGLVDAIMNAVAVDDPEAAPAVGRSGKPVLVDGFSMTERIPLAEDVDEHMEREVLPFAPEVSWDAEAAKVGYEIPFTRLFYTPEPVRSLEEIDADIQSVIDRLAAQFEVIKA